MEPENRDKPANELVEHGNYLAMKSKYGKSLILFSRCCRVPIIVVDEKKACGKCLKPGIPVISNEIPVSEKMESHSNRRWDEMGKDGYVKEWDGIEP